MKFSPFKSSWLLLLLLCVTICASTHAQKKIEGYWFSELTASDEYTIAMNISKESGNISAVMDNPNNKKMLNVPATNIKLKGDSIKMDVPDIRGSLDAVVSGDKKKIEGKWYQFGGPIPVSFEKALPASEGIEGKWVYRREMPKAVHRNLYHISTDHAGKYSAVMFRLNEGAEAIKMSKVYFNNDTLFIVDPFNKVFTGIPVNGGKDYKGSISIKSTLYPCDLRLVNPDTIKEFKPRVGVNGSAYTYSYSRPPVLNDDWKTDSIKSPAAIAKIDELMAAIIREDIKQVHGVTVIKDGKVVLDEYFYNHRRLRQEDVREATTVVTSTLVGLAIDKKFIKSVNDKVYDYYKKEYTITSDPGDSNKEDITLEHLLTMSSGIACSDMDPNSPGYRKKMHKSPDWLKFSLKLPYMEAPGKHFVYCTGNAMLLGGVVERSSNMTIPDFARKYLFDPLNITAYYWDYTPNGVPLTGTGLFLTLRDFAKIGQLYIDNGKWKGKQIISANWVKNATTNHLTRTNGKGFGYLWWQEKLKVGDKEVLVNLANGSEGTKLYVIPALKTVVVVRGKIDSYKEELEILNDYLLPAVSAM